MCIARQLPLLVHQWWVRETGERPVQGGVEVQLLFNTQGEEAGRNGTWEERLEIAWTLAQ
jgi:hypothetical protein